MRSPGAAALAGALWLLCGAPAFAGTTGKIAGRVVDTKQQPIPGTNVVVTALRLGAATDIDGRYTIVNLPPGKCDVKFSCLGHRTVIVSGVEVSADNTTRLDAILEDTLLSMKEVIVIAKAPVVKVNLTSSVVSVDRDRIKELPVQELSDIVNLQAGVVEGHFRGGRLGEVQYQVDGASVNNPYDNTSTLRLDRSLLQEVQVISGTFDAEYGQAMSGVVNAVLRRGTDKFRWDAEVYSGGFVYPGSDRIVDFKLRPTGIQNYQLSLSGPAGLPNTYFLLSGRRYTKDDWVYGTRVFLPTDKSDFQNKIWAPTGDGAAVPLGYTHEWSGVAKLTHHAESNLEVNYQAVWNLLDERRANNFFKLNPDGETQQHTGSIVHGLDVSQLVGKSTIYKVSLRQNYFSYRDMAYDDVNDARYDSALGTPPPDPSYDPGAFLQGVDLGRFMQKTNSIVFTGSLSSQVTQVHQLKFGSELQLPRVQFGHPGFLVYTTTTGGQQELIRHAMAPPDYPAISEYTPVQFSMYGQDAMEWRDINVRAGLRMDYFNARSTVPSDLENPADSIQGAPQSYARPTTAKWALSPRLGVSYPVSDRAALFFAYGHFYQLPDFNNMFGNADYSILARIQAGDAVDKYGVMGNPDIKPQKTVQYQIGFRDAVSDRVGLELNMFYKDIRDLLGSEIISTYTGAEYARFTNVDFGNVLGFTVALTQRQIGLLSTSLDYTWQMARGNTSDPRETATRASAGEDPRPQQAPLDWDQRHTLNMTVSLAKPGAFSLVSILKVGSGEPYTPASSVGFGSGLEKNSGQKPMGVLLDLRAEKDLSLGHGAATAFVRVFNVFDTRFFNGFVFETSGSPYYSRFPSHDEVQLADPTRYYAPRRVEVGLTVGGA